MVYSRTTGCPFISIARRVLSHHAILYQEIYIDRDPVARQRVVEWTGFESVPTLIVAAQDETQPFEVPLPLERGCSPRGINRGSMLTEPTEAELEAWLSQHGFIQHA
ncbi:MAG: glutaredoxin [Anaerolineae bacterium]|nr:glutaredoxin [Anaerolineae bacterium]